SLPVPNPAMALRRCSSIWQKRCWLKWMTNSENETLLLCALGIAVLERGPGPVLSVIGTQPGWVANLLPSGGPHITFQEVVLSSPFLANFFQEAEEFWNGADTILESGTWSQRNLNGDEIAFEAWALRS